LDSCVPRREGVRYEWSDLPFGLIPE
jgi:hypothetical protein